MQHPDQANINADEDVQIEFCTMGMFIIGNHLQNTAKKKTALTEVR